MERQLTPKKTQCPRLLFFGFPLRQATEVELAATRTVVAEQAFTERALRSEADQTAASLAAAECDVGGLRGKVSRQASRMRSRSAEGGLLSAN